MKQKFVLTAIFSMIVIGVVSGLVLGYTTVGIPGIGGGLPFSGYDTSAKMSDEINAVITKSDNSQGNSISISLVDDAGSKDRP